MLRREPNQSTSDQRSARASEFCCQIPRLTYFARCTFVLDERDGIATHSYPRPTSQTPKANAEGCQREFWILVIAPECGATIPRAEAAHLGRACLPISAECDSSGKSDRPAPWNDARASAPIHKCNHVPHCIPVVRLPSCRRSIVFKRSPFSGTRLRHGPSVGRRQAAG